MWVFKTYFGNILATVQSVGLWTVAHCVGPVLLPHIWLEMKQLLWGESATSQL